jgi:A/G-specific adenine glycosylase
MLGRVGLLESQSPSQKQVSYNRFKVNAKATKTLNRAGLIARISTDFSAHLLPWYDREKRDLPWRRTRDPYRVWVSEIMLQQTRVAAVLDHYNRFIKTFPTVQELAAAPESAILAAWSGLGYYRRARSMHAAAREIVTKRSGKFPSSADELRTLPGVGRYTAAAIASIAFGESIAVVDGNVERVLQRVVGRRFANAEAWDIAEGALSRERPGDFNQAMMELGATVCTPRDPKCLTCPILQLCRTQGELDLEKTISRQQRKELHYALNCKDQAVFLVQRAKHASLMPAMWELPQLAAESTISDQAWLTLRHSITVTDYTVHVSKTDQHEAGGRWVAKRKLSQMPLTGLARKILKAAELL